MDPTPQEQLTLIICRSYGFGCKRLVRIVRPAEASDPAAT